MSEDVKMKSAPEKNTVKLPAEKYIRKRNKLEKNIYTRFPKCCQGRFIHFYLFKVDTCIKYILEIALKHLLLTFIIFFPLLR